VELLDRKRQLLLREQRRLATRCAETERQWATACTEAERWGLRAIALGGASDVASSAAGVGGRADIEVPWRNTMGVRHPGDPRCTLPVLAPAQAAVGNAAIAPAAEAYRHALEAAVAHGATAMSLRVIDAELHSTERRQRAIQRHRIPTLEDTLHQLELHLDELEREERVVTRWAQRRRHKDGPRAQTARNDGDVVR